jgi:hypothetical protein
LANQVKQVYKKKKEKEKENYLRAWSTENEPLPVGHRSP